MTCVECQPEMFPFGDQQNEGHMALRFNLKEAFYCRVYLDGEEVTNSCTEAIPGNPGLAVLHTGGSDPRGYCEDCGRGWESIAVSGEVRIEITDLSKAGPK